MMVRSLVQEVVRRRLWPVPLVALLVAIAAPVLFLKPAPAGAPAGAPPPTPAAAKLPASAGGLLNASQRAATRRHHLKGKGQDPFAPPASGGKSAALPGKESAPAAAAAATPPQAIPVVITNAGGSTPTIAAPKTATAPKATTPKAAPTPPPTTPVKTTTYVDVRFAEQIGGMLRYRMPRLQTLRAGGRVAAMFVKYSPARHKAVFAIAPSTKVSGDVTCRRVLGVCRYVDIPAGSYARLTMRGEDGSYLSRRLDVVSIRHMPLVADATPPAKATPLATATCLIKSLLALPATVPSISTDSCG
jgi:hypothetical protein